MKILIISKEHTHAAKLFGFLSKNIHPTPEIMISAPENGRRDLLIQSPTLVLLDIDGDIGDMAEYIVRLAPKYSVPIIVCTAMSGMKYSMVSAGAMDVITFHPNAEGGRERFFQRLLGSIDTVTKALSDNRLRLYNTSAKIIAIGGSTGSTNALPVILQGLNTDCPPVVCVLHMPEGYTKIYAKQLDSSLELDVCEARSGMYIRQGQVIIAAGAKHLRVFKDKKGYFITSEHGVKVCGHCPSVNVLFDSVAYAAKSNAIGVILTGMGRDGASGMVNMKKMGAFNIAQDEETAVIYGMPKAAYDMGAANIQCPLEDIAAQINNRLKAAP